MKIYTADNKLFLDVEAVEGYRFKQIMGDNRLSLNFSLDYYTEVPQGSWCEFNSEMYFLIEAQEPTKNNTQNFDYKLNFDTYVAYLKTQIFEFLTLDKNPDGSVIENSEPSGEFSLTGKPQRFLELLVDNMNLKDKQRGWQVGEYLESDEITIDFSNNFCYDALGILADKFETEWEVEGKTVHLRKVEKLKGLPIPLSYGMNKGLLPGITRSNYQSAIGRIIVKTSDRNIDQSTYGSRVLKMPRATTILYEGVEYVTDNTGTKIQRKNPFLKGNIIPEETLDLTKIYPRRVGTVTEVIEVDDSKGLYDFKDNTIPDELNFKDMIIPGETMIVVFQSGQMTGQGGDNGLTVDYKHTERRFLIKPNTNNGLIVPQGTIVPAVGDKYAVFHIMLPQQYIKDAQNEVLFEAAKKLHERERVEYTYKATLDPIYSTRNWRTIGGFLNIGYFVRLSVPEFFEGSEDIRIVSVREYIDKPMQPVIELSNSVTSLSTYSSVVNQSKTSEQTNNRLREDMINYAKRGWADTQQLIDAVKGMVDDFENSELGADVLKGMVGLFGSESLQFQFLDQDWKTAISPFINFDEKKKQVICHAARVQHMTLGINAVQPNRSTLEYMFWKIPEYISPVLTQGSEPYFLYLKASKSLKIIDGRNTGEATFLLSTTKIKLNDLDGYYTFWVGYLNSENMESDRSFRTMYGYTEILPGQITVDKLLSTSGALVIDLLNATISAKNGATIQGNIKFISNGNYQDVGEEFDKTNNKIENIQIGGRNLILNSKWNHSSNVYGFANTNLELEAEEYTLSANGRIDQQALKDGKDLRIYAWMVGENNVWTWSTSLVINSSSDITASKTFVIPIKGRVYIGSYLSPSGGSRLGLATLNWYKLEKGNKATDWTPAPEDIQKGIDDAKSDASKAQSSADQAKTNVSNLNTYVDGAFKDGVIDNAEAKAIEKYLNTLDETIAQVEASYNKIYVNSYLEGTAKNNLLNAKINLFGARDNLKSSINTAIADGRTTAVEKTDVDSKFATFNARLKDFQNAIEDANKAIQNKLDSLSTDKVNNLQIGGRNYVLGSNVLSQGVSTNSYNFLTLKLSEGLMPNTEYTLSIGKSEIVSGSVVTGFTVIAYNVSTNQGGGVNVVFPVSIEQKYITFRTGALPNNDFTLLLYTGIGGSSQNRAMRWTEVKLEKGNKATDWSPAPEDIQNSINEAKSDASKAQNTADQAKTNVNSLNTYVDGAFKDGMIDNAEAKAIEKYLNTIDETMSQVEATYNKVYANTYLDGSAKTNLMNAKINLFGARDNLKSSINTAIADGKTTAVEKADVDSKFTTFNARLKDFQNAIEDANKAIQNKLDSLNTDRINNIQIGGRNLILNSKWNHTSNVYGFANTNLELEAEEYTLSANGRIDQQALKDGKELRIYAWMLGANNVWSWSTMLSITSLEDTTISKTFVLPVKGRVYIGSYMFPGGESRLGLVTLNWYKLEKGSKATDWTPAPEDIQKGIDDAKSDASKAQSSADQAKTNVSNLNTYVDGAFKDGVIDNAEARAIEKYLNTIDETMSQVEATYNKVYANTYLDGSAKTNLMNAKINLFGARDNLKSSINTAIADGKTTAVEKAEVDSKFATFNARLKDFQNAVEDANKSIQSKLDSLGTDKINNLQIGGRNYILGSNVLSQGVSTNSYNFLTLKLSEGLMPNTEYTLSIGKSEILSGTTIDNFTILVYNTSTNGGGNNLLFPVSSSPRFASFKTSNLPNNGYTLLLYTGISGSSQNRAMKWTEVKLEKGNKATDWSPAPEDIQKGIDDAKSDASKAQNTAGQAKTNVNSLNSYVDGAFKDGVIDNAEAKAIEKYLNTIDETMSQVEATYNKVYANTYLDGSAKTNLMNAKINLFGMRDILKTSIRSAIADGKATILEKIEVDDKFTLFNARLKDFQNAVEDANKSIQNKLDSLSTDKINNLQIGGRNLILNSEWRKTSNVYGFATSYADVEAEEYTLSANGRVDQQALKDGMELRIYAWMLGANNAWSWSTSFVINSLSDTTASKTFVLPVKGRVYIGSYMFPGGGSRLGLVTLNWYKLEKGNKATDWSPAPEDIQKGIDDANKASSEAQSKAEALEYVKTALANRTEIDGGLLLTTLLKLGTFSGQSFTEKAGINGAAKNANDVVAWFGGSLQQAIQNLASIVFRVDGSGQIAKGNISWDTNGNIVSQGDFSSNDSGQRVKIDPHNRAFQVMTSNNSIGGYMAVEKDTNSGIVSMYTNGIDGIGQTYIEGGSIIVGQTRNKPHITIKSTLNQFQIVFNLNVLKRNRNDAIIGEVYLDGESLKVRIS